VALDNLMEDAATAEISRSQLWQWMNRSVLTTDGNRVTRSWVESQINDVVAGLDRFEGDRFDDAIEVFHSVTMGEDFPTFLTLPAYSSYLVEDSAQKDLAQA